MKNYEILDNKRRNNNYYPPNLLLREIEIIQQFCLRQLREKKEIQVRSKEC